MKLKVLISNRHIHLTEDAYRMLYEKNLTKDHDLTQPGEFAAFERLTISNGDNKIEDVRIIGPFRNYNQVEISRRDAKLLGINPPVRRSGDLADAVDLVVSHDDKMIKLKNCCIIANRHVHINESLAAALRIKDNDELKIKVDNDKGGIIKAFAKVSKDGVFELHIDTDDAFSLGLNNNDEVELIM